MAREMHAEEGLTVQLGGMAAEGAGPAFQVLRDRLGSHWVGHEAAGRAEMVRILRDSLGYDKQRARAMIDAMVKTGRLRYHRSAGAAPGTTGAVTDVPFGVWGGVGAPIEPGLASDVGYWQIGDEE